MLTFEVRRVYNVLCDVEIKDDDLADVYEPLRSYYEDPVEQGQQTKALLARERSDA